MLVFEFKRLFYEGYDLALNIQVTPFSYALLTYKNNIKLNFIIFISGFRTSPDEARSTSRASTSASSTATGSCAENLPKN